MEGRAGVDIVVMGILGTPSKLLLSTLPDLTAPHFGQYLGLMFPEAKGNTQILVRQKVAIKGKSLLKGCRHQACQTHRLVKCPGYLAVIHSPPSAPAIFYNIGSPPKEMTEHLVSVHRQLHSANSPGIAVSWKGKLKNSIDLFWLNIA